MSKKQTKKELHWSTLEIGTRQWKWARLFDPSICDVERNSHKQFFLDRGLPVPTLTDQPKPRF
ncbi:hypothetical protein Q7W57_15245 [Stenotrophomonas geniculata]|uniref:Uncharacterized protein n=1 Tax=Stenotrophomonas geniculata TaxID=86188 RepID=A0AAP5C5E1_9GAMM|nr:hypothetical protein [Stenotrophomonas geniculata]MDP4309754.1 hypothetical protein [Stenotrophomonas geniculata]MDQ7953136.1 hypothetical protein [Stenotrophomonas geniculata]